MQDWLTELTQSLKAEIVQEQPKGWYTALQISSTLGMSETAARDMAKRKVKEGLWQDRQVRILNGGQARMTRLYRPVSTSATGARRSR